MTTAAASPWSGSPEFLFGPADIASGLETSGLAGVVREQLSGFTRATGDQAVKEIGRITTDLASVNPVQIIVDALTSFNELQEAGRRTIGQADSAELVELIGHEITFQQQPSINVVVNGQQVATLPMLLSLTCDIQALTATVRTGRLAALQLGHCTATGTIAISGRTVVSRTGPVTLPVSVPLGAGLPLAAGFHDQHTRPSG